MGAEKKIANGKKVSKEPSIQQRIKNISNELDAIRKADRVRKKTEKGNKKKD